MVAVLGSHQSSVLRPYFASIRSSRNHYCLFSTMPEDELRDRLDAFQELFVEARLSIEDCTESAYFDEDVEAAREAVDAAVQTFEQIIADIPDPDQKNRVLRSNGLKVEQLKGELEMAINKGNH